MSERSQSNALRAAADADPDALKEYAKNVFGALGGAMTSAMICLGDQLGLYQAMAGAGPLTSAELAAQTGLAERWLREWLYQQGAAGVLVHSEGDRFELSAEGAAVLAAELHPAFGAGFFGGLSTQFAMIDRLPEAFRSGLGLPYDAHGEEGARGIERGLAPWFKALLVPMVIPRLEGLEAQLREGIAVADVGCGAGVALIELAKAFPSSEFHGYEISAHALDRAVENKAAAAVENVHFHHANEDPLPRDGRFRFVTTFDCLHDMTHPDQIMGQIRRALHDEGSWLIADIKALPSYSENVEKNPMAPMMYGTSIITCMSSALSEADGMGLGTLGLHPQLAQEMTEAAGFTRFEAIDMKHPVNAFYWVRP